MIPARRMRRRSSSGGSHGELVTTSPMSGSATRMHVTSPANGRRSRQRHRAGSSGVHSATGSVNDSAVGSFDMGSPRGHVELHGSNDRASAPRRHAGPARGHDTLYGALAQSMPSTAAPSPVARPSTQPGASAPLLNKSTAPKASGGDDGSDDEEEVDRPCFCWGGVYGCEARRMLSLAAPLALGYVSSQAMAAIGLSFLGYLGTSYLSAATIANVIMYGVYVGATAVLNAMDPLCSQAFGAGKLAKVGLWLQVAILWSTVLFVPPLVAIWWFAGDIMHVFGAVDTSSLMDLTNEFARWSIWWMWPSIAFLCLTIWLESQEVVWPTTIISVAGIGLSYLANKVLIYGVGSWEGLGFIGSPIATAVCSGLQCLALLVWVFCIGGTVKELRTWRGWSMKAFRKQHLVQLLKLGIPMATTELVFDWMFEIITVFSARLGSTEVAVMGVLVNLMFLWQPFLMGMYIAVSIRIGNTLGDNRPEHAKRVWVLGLGLGMVIAAIVSVALYLNRREVARIYSSDPEVVDMASNATPIMALEFFLSSLSFIVQGALEGQGRPQLATAATVVGNWVVGLPCAYVFSHVLDLGVNGLWWGVVVGEVAHFLFMAAFAFTTNWEKQAQVAIALAEKEEAEEEAMLAAMGDSDDSEGDDDDEDGDGGDDAGGASVASAQGSTASV